ncbi:NAD(+) diphosphatase [Streptosporangium sp. CA-135522]|uniref:NAD(+) diphosphatase n=1 Tax=Streptosporangium sp. CA-135522 TaxID=3240072 RepID=UPI003D906F48
MRTPPPAGAALPYNGGRLDRAGARRGDPAWVRACRTDPASVAIPLWRDRCLVEGTTPVTLAAAAAGEASTFLGLEGERAVFAVDLSALDEREALRVAGASGSADVRELFSTLDAERAAILAYARGILRWNRDQRFCGACGGGTDSRDGGHLRVCLTCDKPLFPRIEPAVIVLVEAPGEPRRCLLGRHRASTTGAYSTLAGFVEIGESLEDAVRREVFEEAGVRVHRVDYLASQSWPFPAGLMLGFRATALSEEIHVDGDEVVEARWFTAAQVAEMRSAQIERGAHRGDSIEQFLIDSWMRSPAVRT